MGKRPIIVDSKAKTVEIVPKPKRPSGVNRSEAEREKDLETVSRLYLQGKSLRAIGEVVGASYETVRSDMAELRNRWLESSIRDFDAAKAQELAKIDFLEMEYWDCWEASKNQPVLDKLGMPILIDKDDKGKPIFMTEPPDAQWLNGVKWCIEKRSQIFGLDAPKEVNLNVFNADAWKQKAQERLADGLKTLELFDEGEG